MSTNRVLPARPDLGHLKRQAEDLRDAFTKGNLDARSRVSSVAQLRHLAPSPVGLSLTQAQFVIAREYGFESWPKLKHHVETVRGAAPVAADDRIASAIPEPVVAFEPRAQDLVVTDTVLHLSLLNGNVLVEAGGELHLVAPVSGTMIIRSGGTASLAGRVGGTVVVEAGGACHALGTVGGKLVNRGGMLDVRGTVGGSVLCSGGTTDIHAGVQIGGDLTVEPGATVRCAGKVLGQVINHGGVLDSKEPNQWYHAGGVFDSSSVDSGWLGRMLSGILGGVGKRLGDALGGGFSDRFWKLDALERLSELEMLTEVEALSRLDLLEKLRGRSMEASRPVEEKLSAALTWMGGLTGTFTNTVQAVADKRVEAKYSSAAASARLHAEAEALKVEARAIMTQVREQLDLAVSLAEEASRLRSVAV